MRCYHCGYINFQRVNKCPSCNTSLKGTESHLDLAEDPSFTIFAGELPDFGSGNDSDVALDEEFGIQESKPDDSDFGLDLDEAKGADAGFDEAEGADAGFDEPQESSIASGLGPDVGPNDFELDLSEAIAEQVMASSSLMPSDAENTGEELEPDLDVAADDDLDLEPTVAADAETDLDDMGFDLDDAGEADPVKIDKDALDLDLGAEDEEPTLDLDTEPEIELPDEEPAVSVNLDPEPEIELPDEEPEVSVNLDPKPEIELPDEEPALELSGEPEVSLDLDTEKGDEISFSMDDTPESVKPAETAEEVVEKKDEGGIDLGGLEMEEAPEKEK